MAEPCRFRHELAALARGWFGNVSLDQVQFGFEITSSSGGFDLVSNSFSVTFS